MSQLRQQQQLLTQELSIPQILLIHGKRFTQIMKRYSNESDGRCAVGVIMSYFGWNGRHDSEASNSLQTALHALKDAGIRCGSSRGAISILFYKRQI